MTVRREPDTSVARAGLVAPNLKFSISEILGLHRKETQDRDWQVLEVQRRLQIPAAYTARGFCNDCPTSREDMASFSWLHCSRYHPPRLNLSETLLPDDEGSVLQIGDKKKEGRKERKLGRSPRIPFAPHQVAALERKFHDTHYLSSQDVADLSLALNLTDTRVKIWFQNRRARERREMEPPAVQRARCATVTSQCPCGLALATTPLTPAASVPAMGLGGPSFKPLVH